MEERRRVILWTAIGFLSLMPMAISLVDPVVVGSALCLTWPIFIIGLVLLGMALAGGLRLIRGKKVLLAGSVVALGLALVALLLADEAFSPAGQAMTFWGFMVFMTFSYLLITLWQVLLDDEGGGFLTASAYIDAAWINLALSIVLVNALRTTEPGWPDNAKSVALILAFALISTVLSLSAMYAKRSPFHGERAWAKPVWYAILFGLIMPILGILVIMSTQGFSAPS